jgi:hypothetical protein
MIRASFQYHHTLLLTKKKMQLCNASKQDRFLEAPFETGAEREKVNS